MNIELQHQVEYTHTARLKLCEIEIGMFRWCVGIGCWNPAFDVTPAELISGIITEKGVFKPAELCDRVKEIIAAANA